MQTHNQTHSAKHNSIVDMVMEQRYGDELNTDDLMKQVEYTLEREVIGEQDEDYRICRRIYNFENNPKYCCKCHTCLKPNGRVSERHLCDEFRVCPTCQGYRAIKEMMLLQELCNKNQELYVLYVKDENWDTVYKYISRHEAEYSRFPQADDMNMVYVNSDLDGRAEKVHIDNIEDMKATLSKVPLFKSISHSKKKEGKGQGEGNGEAEEEEGETEKTVIRIYGYVHEEYPDQVDEIRSFKEAMIEVGKEVSTPMELERIMYSVLNTYSEKMGSVLTTFTKQLGVDENDIATWNQMVSEYILSSNRDRNHSDNEQYDPLSPTYDPATTDAEMYEKWKQKRIEYGMEINT